MNRLKEILAAKISALEVGQALFRDNGRTEVLSRSENGYCLGSGAAVGFEIVLADAVTELCECGLPAGLVLQGVEAFTVGTSWAEQRRLRKLARQA